MEPVNWQEMGLLDYPTIIKKPMDFSTILKNLNKCRYTTYEEIFDDIQLIWDNCKKYNKQGSPVYKLGEKMEKISKLEITKFRQTHNIVCSTANAKKLNKRNTKIQEKELVNQ